MNTASLIIGVVAFIFFGISLLQKDLKKILLLQLIANILYAFQYGFLGAFSAVVMNAITVIRITTYYFYEKDNKKAPAWVLYTFLLLIIAFGLKFYDGLLSLIPPFITIVYCIAAYQKSIFVFRILYLITAFIWIYYNVRVGAYTGLLGNAFEIITGSLSLYLYRTKLKQ